MPRKQGYNLQISGIVVHLEQLCFMNWPDKWLWSLPKVLVYNIFCGSLYAPR